MRLKKRLTLITTRNKPQCMRGTIGTQVTQDMKATTNTQVTALKCSATASGSRSS